MYGSFSFSTFLGIVFGVALIIALSFLASPLVALIIAIPIALVGLVIASGQRRRSDQGEGKPAVTPEGKPTSPTGSRSTGAPASGEGQS
jgi:hypothetical protein